MEIGVKTDVGKIRDNNQDAYYISQKGDSFLFIIADGMGGHKAGEIASKMAIDIISNSLESLLTDSTVGDKEIQDKIRSSIYEANDKIYRKSMEDEKFQVWELPLPWHMQWINIFIGHAGDSRAYLFRDVYYLKLQKTIL